MHIIHTVNNIQCIFSDHIYLWHHLVKQLFGETNSVKCPCSTFPHSRIWLMQRNSRDRSRLRETSSWMRLPALTAKSKCVLISDSTFNLPCSLFLLKWYRTPISFLCGWFNSPLLLPVLCWPKTRGSWRLVSLSWRRSWRRSTSATRWSMTAWRKAHCRCGHSVCQKFRSQ